MDTVILSLVKEIGKLLWDPIKPHFSYLFCYVRNVDILEYEVTILQQRQNEVQQDVDEAKQRGQEICHEVEQWLTRADNMNSRAEGVVARSENTKCWNGCCWNPVLCYGLGKEAAKQKINVRDLINDGKFDRVSRPPPPPRAESLLPNRGFQLLATTEKKMNSIFDALKDNEINIIGVHGMGGVGKTTLMKEVAKKAEHDKLFDKVIMVIVSQTIMIDKIQKEIGDMVGFDFGNTKDISVRAAKLSSRLRQEKKLLVILDDLWKMVELSDIGIPYGDAHKGCKIVITSRSSDVCSQMIVCHRSQPKECKIEVKPLLLEESLNLFRVTVGDVVNSNELSEIAMNIVKECGGLPLAIVILGLALCNKSDPREWNAVLKRLKNANPEGIIGMEKGVFQSIQYSYDHLGSDEQVCFLLCCLFREDMQIHEVDITRLMVGEWLVGSTETLDEAEDQVSLLFNNLKASGLLLKDDNERSVKMHDIVRDVAIWIAASDQYGFYSRPGTALKEWPRNIKTNSCRRISLQYNEISELPHEPMTFPNLHTLLLNGNQNLEMIPEEFFSEMKALKVLDLSSTKISSLPSSLSSLMNLRVLLLCECRHLKDLSGIGASKSLEVLDLFWVDTRVLPTELGELSNLRSLNLSFTSCMIPSGVISRLTRLEELNMQYSFEKWQPEGHEDGSSAAFAELACLSRLRSLRVMIKDERCFHQDLGHNCFQELKTFRILRPDYKWYSGHTTALTIVASVVPDWAKLLAGRAKELFLHQCPGVEFLDGGLDISITTAFSNIKHLQLIEMKDLCRLCQMAPPDGFLANLKNLRVNKCDKLTNIFSSDLISRAHQLEELKVHHCAQLCHVFQYDSALGGESHDPILLSHLTTLQLHNLPQLTSIWEGGAPPQSLGNLRQLSIENCHSLKHVFTWGQFPSLTSLVKLSIERCHSLKHVFTWGQFQSLALLESLKISNCSGMVAIIMLDEANSEVQVTENNSNMLPRLKLLHLQDLEIASFDEEDVSLFDWPSLEKVSIKHCPNLKKLPLSSHGAPGLHKIHGSKEWFQALEWEDENIKSRLQSLFVSNDLEDTQDSTSQ